MTAYRMWPNSEKCLWREVKVAQQMGPVWHSAKWAIISWKPIWHWRQSKNVVLRLPVSDFNFFFVQFHSQGGKFPLNLKDVKPKVDSHWKKNEAPTAKRRSSQTSPPKLVTTKAVRFAKVEVPQIVTIKAAEGKSFFCIQSSRWKETILKVFSPSY